MAARVSERPRRTVAADFGYLEAARFKGGKLFFSEMKHKKVYSLTDHGAEKTPTIEVVAEIPTRPSGLGWIGDSLSPSSTPIKASELSPHAIHANDMAVHPKTGIAYISHFGYDWFSGEKPRPTGLVVRFPDGRVEISGEGLEFPNGLAVSADGETLFVSESFGTPETRLTAFPILPSGLLGPSRIIASFGPPETHVVDGICIDKEDGVWVSFCILGEYRRILPNGECTDIIRIPKEGGNYVVDSTLGGAEGRTLYMLIADATVETINAGFQTTARIDAIEVDVAAKLE